MTWCKRLVIAFKERFQQLFFNPSPLRITLEAIVIVTIVQIINGCMGLRVTSQYRTLTGRQWNQECVMDSCVIATWPYKEDHVSQTRHMTQCRRSSSNLAMACIDFPLVFVPSWQSPHWFRLVCACCHRHSRPNWLAALLGRRCTERRKVSKSDTCLKSFNIRQDGIYMSFIAQMTFESQDLPLMDYMVVVQRFKMYRAGQES